MSDINIPGVSSNLNTDKIINDTMKLERMPLVRMQKSVETIKTQEAAWQDINRNIATVRTSANKLYSFDNPFEDKTASSSYPNVLGATVTRSAQAGEDKITVQKIATADSFLSKSLPNDYSVPAGTYTFGVGSDKITIQYGGGSLTDFAKLINQKAGRLLQASVVNDSATTQVFQITSKKTGSANKLSFENDAQKFGIDTGILSSSGSTSRTVGLTTAEVQPWTKPLAGMDYSVANGALTLGPGSEVSLPVTPPVAAQPGLVLEVKLNVQDIPHGESAAPSAPSGPSIPSTGSIQFKGLTIQSQPSQAPLPPWQPPAPPKVTSDLGVLYLSDGTNTVKLPPVKDGEQTITVPYGSYVQTLAALDIRNDNTYRRITIESVKVYNPNARGAYTPANPVTQAGDAELDLNGIHVTRGSNTINDLIPGATLTLNEPSPAPVTLDIAPDTKSIKDAIINFIGNYNKLMSTIEIYTSNDPKVIDEITYLNDQERQKAHQDLGLFQGDITLAQMQSRLEEYMMNPYKTDEGRKMALLAQIGISTDTSKTFSGVDISKLRGYLEIDEQKLDSALKNDLPAVKQLFGNDTTGDFVINSGAAYMVDHYLQAFNQTGGIIAEKIQSYNQTITQTNQQIDTLKQQLTQKEQSLRDKYNQMEGAVQQLQQSQRSINSLNGNMFGSSGGSSSGGP